MKKADDKVKIICLVVLKMNYMYYVGLARRKEYALMV
ncbi:hypothetical protein FHU26_003658 [Clostridium beijerinckii]|nr:hypothetical protein [Clostridium beijerinckii]